MAEGTRYGHESGETVFLTDSTAPMRSLAENHRVFERALRRSVEALLAQGKRVWMVAAVPEVGWDVLRCWRGRSLRPRAARGADPHRIRDTPGLVLRPR